MTSMFNIQDVKEEEDGFAVYQPSQAHNGGSPEASEANKRTSAEVAPEMHQSSSRKRARVCSEVIQGLTDDGLKPKPLCLDMAGENVQSIQERSRLSYRKPLFSISHRISDKRNTPSLDQQANQGSFNSILSPKLQSPELNGQAEIFTPQDSLEQTSPVESSLHPLIEKMFFILNTLSSSMTQLHSKVDSLTLEVMRIKKQLKPGERTADFHPPAEYLLTNDELNQLTAHTSSAGELSCQLLVHLFPELFKAKDCPHNCTAGKRTLESLHLELIRNYVEVCYPSVKNDSVWQEECLHQINDFFNRFWAKGDTENTELIKEEDPISEDGLKVDHPQTYSFIKEQGQEENVSLDNQQGCLPVSEHGLNNQAPEELDDFSSVEDLVIFLMHRLFPEVFEEGKIPEVSSSYSQVGQLILDSDKMEILRKYMEANFPDVPEDSWLQLCIQHIEDTLEGLHSNGSESDNVTYEGYDLASFQEDVHAIRFPEAREYERRCRKYKKSLLPPVDFENLKIPPPDFNVPQEYILSREQLKSNYECSLSIGNFASRLLVLIFPELFTHENARKQYNYSGSLGKKQLDPIRVNLIRHYVQLVYPRARNDRVWMLEFVGKLDERCRRPDTEQRRSYLQQRKVTDQELEQEFFCRINHKTLDNTRDDSDFPSLPPEKSSKDFCKIPLDQLTISQPDFPVPSAYLLSDSEVREIVQQSLSVGNFAARLLVRLFPELFTPENLRLQYNHSGACNKKQLDPVRLRLIRHYVEAVYPVDKMEEVWHYECVPSIDERCRRPNRKKCDILKKAKRSNTVS
ncbi:BEN domain-containing protein 3 [Cyprinodon tularosa]|uniref:BEN domain-containing protein 3-like n=1 Tax=Cyprinodon tularosa TaxID=77115 RepID=UPI0018E207BA|nr:BEN domain-containing protein 3-like [Cyprinodon tularosa]XP_038128053.1 BEN domain-containing protein 3-like [Cyprinodon tularosa]XP_038158275.1 BEN domain-containing protein 3 [Cyprinodon tularosa]XP_038158276.1 BEN domain-containing protein 3 [Cyprinodon tularosa]